MQRIFKIFLAFSLILLIGAPAQAQKVLPVELYFLHGTSWLMGDTSKKTIPMPTLPPIRSIGRSLYVQQLSFFCKKEWEMEKSIKIPIRFRLGSMEYVNWLEGKR